MVDREVDCDTDLYHILVTSKFKFKLQGLQMCGMKTPKLNIER